MSDIFIQPNWHPIAIHFPLALLVTGLVIEVFSSVHSSLRRAGRWMILLGALSSIVAAFTGIYALDDVVFRSQRESASHASERPWRNLALDARLHGGREPSGSSDGKEDQDRTARTWKYLSRHAWIEGPATLIVTLTAMSALAFPSWARQRRTYILLLALLLLGAASMAWGAWYSGDTVYHDAAATELKGKKTESAQPGAAKSFSKRIGAALEHFAGPPLQAHVSMAGLTVALVLVALALTIRKSAEAGPAATRLTPGAESQSLGEDLPGEESSIGHAGWPSVRFWVLAIVAGVFAAFLGLWALSRPDEAATWAPTELWATITDKADNPDAPMNRRTAHVLMATAILLLSAALAAFTHWVPNRKRVIAIMALLLVVTIGTQLWLGILLLYDGKGVQAGQRFYQFRPPEQVSHP